MRSSQEAFDLIVEQEVTSKAVYEKKYQRPEWPGASSGVTVGIGYDLGQTTAATIRKDWQGVVDPAMLEVMVGCSGITGDAAKAYLPKVHDKIFITWDQAIKVHQNCVIPKWEKMVSDNLPNTDILSPNQFGALTSLTFNRGASYNKDGDRYKEMRNIKTHMANKNLAAIPNEIRSMKRLWEGKNLPGLLARRDAEADLFETG